MWISTVVRVFPGVFDGFQISTSKAESLWFMGKMTLR